MKRLITLALVGAAAGALAADLEPWMLNKGESLFAEDFSGSLEAGGWSVVSVPGPRRAQPR